MTIALFLSIKQNQSSCCGGTEIVSQVYMKIIIREYEKLLVTMNRKKPVSYKQHTVKKFIGKFIVLLLEMILEVKLVMGGVFMMVNAIQGTYVSSVMHQMNCI